MEKWAIHIDIEGFGSIYGKKDQAMHSLRALMDGIYRIGSNSYSEFHNRLFAHQTGDGFIIVSDLANQTLERPICIAIALMRHLLLIGGVGKSTIAKGDLADIMGCYPQHILDAKDIHNRVRLGSGIMTLSSVMGTALIRAVGVDKDSPSGSLLLVRQSLQEYLPENLQITKIANCDLFSIDWIHTESDHIDLIKNEAGLKSTNTAELEQRIKTYMQSYELKSKWMDNTQKYLSLNSP